MTKTPISTGGTDVARIANSSTTRTSPRAAITAKLDHPVAEKVRQNHEERLADIEKALVASPPSVSRGTLLGVQLLPYATGTYTPTAGTRLVIVRFAGGGGGGAGVATSVGTTGAAGGGNSGWFVECGLVAASLIAGGKYTCGAGGAAGVQTGGPGGAGGDTTITINGVTLTAKGGTGGTWLGASAGNGLDGSPSADSVQPAQTGMIRAYRGAGGFGWIFGGVIGNGASGHGGTMEIGAGGAAVGGSTQNGRAGSAFGGGGSGAYAGGAGAQAAGGAGAVGAIVIEEYA